MSLETSLLESSRGLASERATDRKKAAESLKTFLSGNAAPCLLTENSQKKRGYSWDDLFNDVHEYILKEIEKYDISKSFESAVKPLSTSLLHMTVTGSKKGNAYIKCERITSACLFILKSNRMSKAMGDAYINLLYKYVIPCEFYMGYISPKTWEELLDVSISVCNSKVSALDNFSKLRLVWLLVKNGSSSCQLINPLRDSLPRLQKLFLVPTTDKKVQEVIIDILLHLLETLSSDYRLAMCKLTETIFGTMITFYNQNIDKKKSSLFKLFHMIVVLHHPQGRLQHEQGSLAYSWNKWNRHLNSVLELIYLEVKVLQKTTDSKFRVKDNITKDSEQLFSLAAAVLYQVFNMPPVQPVEDEAGSSSKRQKVAFNKNKTFADLIDELRQNHSLWLGITTTYIKNCGDKVSAGDSLSLLHILDNYVTSNNNGLHWGMFEELVGLTLRNLCAQAHSKIDELDRSKVLLSLWNSCVRHSTLSNLVHKAMHGVLQSLLMCQVINYKNVQPLVKLYQDKAMPVTDYSVKTLSLILSVFFTKYNDPTDKLKFFQWFISTEITCTDMTGLQDLFLRLISNQNVNLQAVRKPIACDDTLHEILFNTVDKCILFSEFELDLPQPQPVTRQDSARKFEVHTQVQVQIQNVLEATLIEQRENAKGCETKLVEYSKYIRLVLNYADMLVKYTNQNLDHIKKSKLYNLVKVSLRYLIASLTALLNKGNESADQTELLHNVQAILSSSYYRGLSTDVRAVIDQDFFICVHNVINKIVEKEEDDDMDVDSYPADMRRSCICLLAAYCKEFVNYREEILDLILDHKLYNFQYYGDIECAFRCMNTLIDAAAETCPIERIFGLMQNMCKDLFRNTKAIGGLLKILLTMLDTLWSHASSTMRGNCLIMVTGLLQRCEKQYYPPHVAALIYECVARMEALNKEQTQRSFRESLLAATKCDMHSVRLYCCYLMKYVAVDYEPSNIETHLSGIFDFFLIDVNGKTEQMLSDELANRTLTVLHEFVALAQTKSTLTNNVVAAVLTVQKEKSLDKNLVKKVLDKIANLISLKGIDEYLNRNVLSLSHSWFSANYKLAELPVYLLGLSGTAAFLKDHLKWVVPAEILWAKDGKIENSEILFQITNDTNTKVEDVIESCFCTIIVLCLPYVVAEKYNLHYRNQLKQLTYDQRAKSAATFFQLTRQVLGNEKWSMLYVETMGELVLLTALHLADCNYAKEVFGLDVPQPTDAFYYPSEVFNAVLQYYGELITEDIMQYLSENQPMVISKVILKLWENVLQKTILEYKALSLSSYLRFIENVPMGYNSDHFVCNFSCSSLLRAAKSSTDKHELKLYIRSLDILLRRFLPEKGDVLQETLPVVLSVLTIKKDEGFAAECGDLLVYLASSDQVDGMAVLSQTDNSLKCASMKELKETLTNFLATLKCPSYEVLCNFKRTLQANKPLINKLCKQLNLKGFSEDCKTSLLHQVINILNDILVSDADNKTILEACDCLSTTGTYDLKTLVMLAPPDSRHVTDMRPAQYLAIVVLRCLSQLLADEAPALASKVMVTLARLLKYREGKIAFDLGEVDQQILRQFLPASNNYVQAKFQLDPAKFESYGAPDLWVPADSELHGDWITRLTTALLDTVASGDNYLSSLGIVCKSKPTLCRSILPSLIGVVLHVSKEEHITILAEQINTLLNYFWEKTSQQPGSCSADNLSRTTSELGHEHKLIVQDLLNVVNFVRLQRSHYVKRHEEYESLNYLRLEYDKVAWAAAVSDNSLAALYYGELCASARHGGVPPCGPEQTAQLVAGEHIQSIFRKCFTSIGELDAIDGCGSGHLTSEAEKRRHLINTRQYSDALLEHDIALSSDSDACCDISLQGGVVRSLHKSGMHHLALQYIKSLPENDQFDDVKYECLSFLGDWSVFVDANETENKLKSPNVDIHSILKEFRYACLKDCLTTAATTHGFDEKLIVPLSKAKLAVSKLCQKLNMDNCQSVYTAVSQLQMFSDIEEYFSVRSGKLPLPELLDRWQLESLAPFQDFRHVEALISQRSLILEHAAKQNCNLLNDIVKLQLNYAELGLSNQRIPLSQRLLAMARKCQMTGDLSMVEGQISWAKGHKDIALSLIRNVMYDDSADVALTAAALRQYGLWMAESKCESARDIIDKYLKRSLEVLGGDDSAGTKLKVYYDIAKFADAEYKQVVAYMKSPIFENKVKCMENMKDAATQALRSTQNKSLSRDEMQELRKAIVTNEKMSHLDEAEITSTMAEKKRFLDLAMRYYLLSLVNSEENNLSVFRVISLWLDNPSFRFEEPPLRFEELLLAVPARKYLPVLPQLAPRLAGTDDAFNCNLTMLLKKCATEHPHHTLPILFSLTNSDKDLRILNAAGRVRGSAAAGTPVAGREEPRAAAAGRLLHELAGQGAAAGRRVEQMERLCDAIISFANYTSKTKDSRQEVPKSEPIRKLSNLDEIPIPTITLPVRHDCDYTHIPAIVSFADSFELVGGLHCPKKMTCKGSDGKQRTLLIKGEDDLRQDAVMQQVFTIVNTLLELDPVTSRKKLLIRTYKVVPLSRRSGVLEWCEGTTPIGTYLASTGARGVGAHARYRPMDISCNAARAKLSTLHKEGRSRAEKLRAFQRILREFKPAFHYFFTDHYLEPATWYERRLAYTKSVATSSMVGYIMGIGDRHVQNILIDKNTAEVIHIDFGIAFDQAKVLPTPETVPFRLTQDIVAGFGCCGVEGVFRRCCETTMQLLRDHHEVLLTILEVLLCDPLYSWTITQAEANRKQNITATGDTTLIAQNGGGSSGGLASRTLLAVGSKLAGTAGGAAGGVAVAGQVARLLRAAADPVNLSVLYPGWQPYL